MGEAAKTKRFKSLGIRAASGFVMLLICGIPVYFGGFAYLTLVLVLATLMMREWVRMCDHDQNAVNYAIGGIGCVAALVLAAFGMWPWALLVIPAMTILMLLVNMKHPNKILLSIGAGYITATCLAALWLRGLHTATDGTLTAGLGVLIFIIVAVIMADSFAYLGGSLIGGAKLAPKISPNKTWAGFFSGVLFAGLFGGALATAFDVAFVNGLGLGVVIAIVAVIGDIFESAAKRHLGVKDSGTLLPGHGGILDRVDSLVLALLVSAVLLYFFPHIWPPLVGA